MANPAPTAILTFSLGSQVYALPIEDVVEVAAMVELVTLPDAAPEILGVVNRRGQILPMLDLRRIFKQPAAPVSSANLFIVAAHAGKMAGLVVDEVRLVEYVNSLENLSTSGKIIRGIINHKEQLIQIISLPMIMATYLPDQVAAEGNS
ncbi:MAG: chemotaxis protein CheW [Chloroflexi bacterium]|nr:chemotaxis protein CheW [Chloroflexota bacterium]